MRVMRYFIGIFICLLLISGVSALAPDFTVDSNQSMRYGFLVTFQNNTPTEPIISQAWSFGDNYTSTLPNPSHYYSTAGLYTVNVSFVNASGTTFVNKTRWINLTSDVDYESKAWSHFDGINGGTTFRDELGNAILANLVTTSNTQIKFGNASASFGNDASYLTGNDAFNFSTGDYTIEGWVYPTSSDANRFLVSKTNLALTQGWGMYQPTSSTWVIFIGGTANSSSPFTIPLNSWNHVAVVRNAGIVNVYVNGSRVMAPILTANGNYDTINPFKIGDIGVGTPRSFRGYIDEFRAASYARWTSNFSVPTVEYKGDLYIPYPDLNPYSTFRFKTDTPAIADIANFTRGGVRNRTIQIQNINGTNYITGSMTFDPTNLYLKTIYPNLSTYNDITIVDSTINNELGTLYFNLTRPGGFTVDGNRVSVIDTEILYWNYTPNGTSSSSFFGYGRLLNTTTGYYYPVRHFIETVLTYGDWKTFGNFSVINKTPIIFEQPVLFIPELNYTANRFLWNFGDGTTLLSYNQTESHMYTTNGTKNVTLTAYIWQNESVTNTTTMIFAVNAEYNESYIDTNFTSNVTSGIHYSPYVVQFNDTTYKTPTQWTWNFGDGYFSYLQNPVHIYNTSGYYTVTLTSSNNDNMDSMTKTNYVTVDTHYPKSQSALKGNDLEANIFIGVVLLLLALVIGSVGKMMNK